MRGTIATGLGAVQLTESTPADLLQHVTGLVQRGMRLDSLVGVPGSAGVELLYVFSFGHTKVVHRVMVPREDLTVPSLVPLLPECDWPERRIRDLMGVRPVGHPRAARLVRHAHWPKGFYPLTHDPAVPIGEWGSSAPMQLVRVRGEGIHEIPVGPIHAGIIEPGHFRFSADGERIVGLEPRLFYVHRGMEWLARGRTPREVLSLAEVVSGDSAIGHGWAFCEAIEAIAGIEPPVQAQLLRAALLETERITAHITDLGGMLNDIAVPAANTRFLGLREDILRANAACFGHRFLRGVLVPGGVNAPVGFLGKWAEAVVTAGELAEAHAKMWLNRAAVVERLERTGTLQNEVAQRYRAVGLAARASGVAHDARSWSSCPAYSDHEVITQRWGDVMARFLIRVREIEASVRLLTSLASEMGPGVTTLPRTDGDGLGSVEGWRGECLHFVRVEAGRVVAWVPQDPSAHNWRLLSLAATEDVIPDFPVVNKSFDLSYAGNDL